MVAILAFLAGRYVHARPGRRTPGRLLDVIDIAALAFAHGVIALLTWTLLAVILEQSFIGAEVFALPAADHLGRRGGRHAPTPPSTRRRTWICSCSRSLLAVFLAEGVIASMLTASDPEWWKNNLSALGMTDDLSALAFNLTLIVAGIIVTTLARYATQGIPTPNPHGRRAASASRLVVVGVFLGAASACSRSTSSSRSTPASRRAWSSPTACS